ncbi:MAG: SCO family protein [Acidimicrobiales bacterium]
MGTGLKANNPLIVSAFHGALLRGGLAVLVILVLLAVAWNILRSVQLRRARGAASQRGPVRPEPVARRLLRVSFGLIWIFDGILQGQAAMPLGMTTQVIQPTAAASPAWVQHLVNAAATTWSFHPISAPAAAVWIQIGIGVWLLAAPRGDLSRLAGLASVGWGLIVWVFGETFGGIFAPGLTVLFGAPGAALLYCLAGMLIALPERSWASPRLGANLCRVMGLFFVGMAVLQAWPNRGFWQGQGVHAANPGTLTAMVAQMSQTSQPGWLSSWVAAFGGFDAAHGWGVNLFAVVVLVVIGLALLSARPRLVRVGVIAGVVACLADWVLIEDLGFLGGVGTDPNSMIPIALVLVAGYLALTRVPAPAPEVGPAEGVVAVGVAADEGPGSSARPRWRERLVTDPTYAFRLVAALGAIAIALVGAAPMAVAAVNPNAAPILAQAMGDTPTPTNNPAPAFNLVDQTGQTVSLASLHGKAIAITFLDPVCTSECPIIAQDFRIADGLLGSDARRVEMVAVDANPRYITPDYLLAFDRQERMTALPNWHYLTGTLTQLRAVWRAYGVVASYAPGGAMVSHTEIAYVIDPTGVSRYIVSSDQGAATEATRSSFAVNLAGAIKSALR